MLGPGGCDPFSQGDRAPYCSSNLWLFKKKIFSSWDRFLVPYPWGKGVFIWGNPIWVAPQASKVELENKRCELEAELNQMTLEADVSVQ